MGGVGGSGTRVVAEILLLLGYFIGASLNTALDNLVFTRLFQRPKWLRRARQHEVVRCLRVFDRYMNKQRWTIGDVATYLKALYVDPTYTVHRRKEVKAALLRALTGSSRDPPRWGFKEPICHIFLPELCDFYERLKYVHVIRHGLDMAFSKNRNQLMMWPDRYGVRIPKEPARIPVAQLEYWIKANRRAMEVGCAGLGRDFFLFNFDAACRHPEYEIPRFVEFLGSRPHADVMDQLIDLPRVPSTSGRYKKHDLSVFPAEHLAEVSRLGFDVER